MPAVPPRRRALRSLLARLVPCIATASAACISGGSDIGRPSPPRLATADSLRAAGQLSAAAAHYRALRDSLTSAGDTAHLWRVSLSHAGVLTRLARFDSARAALGQMTALAAHDMRRRSALRRERALMLSRSGQLDSALFEAGIARRLASDAGDPRAEVNALHVVGEASSLSGRYTDGIAANERMLALSRTLRDTQLIALALNQVAIDYRHVGRFDDARRAYEQALALHRATQNVAGMTMVTYNLSNVFASTGDLARAVEMREEALAHATRTGDMRGQALVLAGLGAAQLQAGNHRAARPYLVRSLALARELRLPYQQVVAQLSLGELALLDGDAAGAALVLHAALSTADSLRYGRQRASIRAKLARAALAAGNGAEAARWAEAAGIVADSLGDPEAQFEALQARGAVLEGAGSADAAAAYLHAIDLVESSRGRLAFGDLRLGLAEPWAGAYEGAIRALLGTGRAEEAFMVAERARARMLLDVMSERGARGRAATRLEQVRERLREREETRRSVRSPSLKVQAAGAVAALADTLEQLESEARSSSAASRVRHATPATLQAVRDGLLAPGRALLMIHWGDSAVYGWWITRGELRAARLGRSDSLGVTMDFLRAAIERPTAGVDWKAGSRRAFDELVAPLHPSGEREWLVVVDGPVAYVPMEVLIPGDGAAPLGATHRVTYAPSASVALHLASASRPTAWSRAMLAIGNPAPTAGGSAFPSTSRDGSSERLAPLPHAAEEARRIGALFRSDGSDVLIGRQATVKRWLDRDPARYRFIHVAAHARVSDRRPEQTHIVLSDAGLDLAAIRRLPLRAELVTLSACESAQGQRVRGEGVIGLPHAFLSAGAQGIVVTLWRIEDRSAARFMEDFYALVHAGATPAEALLQVRRGQLQQDAEAHPSAWAPFVLVGTLAG